MAEAKNLAEIKLNHPREMTLFRNSCGNATYKDNDGKTYRVPYGVGGKGGSDLVGLTRVTITQEMVGKQIAVFTACEVKDENGKASPEQIHFIDFVNNNGGIAIVARHSSELRKAIDDYKNK